MLGKQNRHMIWLRSCFLVVLLHPEFLWTAGKQVAQIVVEYFGLCHAHVLA